MKKKFFLVAILAISLLNSYSQDCTPAFGRDFNKNLETNKTKVYQYGAPVYAYGKDQGGCIRTAKVIAMSQIYPIPNANDANIANMVILKLCWLNDWVDILNADPPHPLTNGEKRRYNKNHDKPLPDSIHYVMIFDKFSYNDKDMDKLHTYIVKNFLQVSNGVIVNPCKISSSNSDFKLYKQLAMNVNAKLTSPAFHIDFKYVDAIQIPKIDGNCDTTDVCLTGKICYQKCSDRLFNTLANGPHNSLKHIFLIDSLIFRPYVETKVIDNNGIKEERDVDMYELIAFTTAANLNTRSIIRTTKLKTAMEVKDGDTYGILRERLIEKVLDANAPKPFDVLTIDYNWTWTHQITFDYCYYGINNLLDGTKTEIRICDSCWSIELYKKIKNCRNLEIIGSVETWSGYDSNVKGKMITARSFGGDVFMDLETILSDLNSKSKVLASGQHNFYILPKQ